ncbi:MAG: hypothetical protein AAGM22_18745, partial [Acidobacteriota bacterium]
STLAATVREIADRKIKHQVAGHGPVADAESISLYRDMLDHMEEAGRRSHGKGQTPEEAAKEFKAHAGTADWHVFQDTYCQTAIAAWHRELG